MEGTVKKLKIFFERKQEILMAFVFGSAAAGRAIPGSDVDVAVWFGKDYDIHDVNKLQEELEALVCRNVDLIVLNQARPAIAWTALRGKELLIRDYRLYLNKLLDFSTEAEDFQCFVLDFWNLRMRLRKAAA